MRKFLAILLVSAVVIVGAYTVHQHSHTANTSPTTKSSTQTPTEKSGSTFDKHLYSTTDPTSIWVVVNKQHSLNPKDYVPKDLVFPNVPLRVPGNESMQLRQVTATAMEEMFAAAKKDGIELMLSSGYRSYTYQVNLYNGYVASQGQATADTQSARPGYSEHQTGLAADVEPASKNCEVEECFGDTPEGTWVAANAYKYGFIVRYTTGNESVTGYEPEPWHIRYVGTELSNELHRTNTTTLEQFFGIKGGTVYN
ncbi:MAG: M15 family metallopeptidase [Candidatus Saccharimonadales bacterium]